MNEVELLNELEKGVVSWNRLREKYPKLKPVFSYIDFSGLKLSNVNLTKSEIIGCRFDKSDLAFANFSESKLDHCTFISSNLGCALFHKSLCRKVNFQNAYGHLSEFQYARCDESNFSSALFSETKFEYTSLKKSNFINADLTRANLQYANLQSAGFFGATLEEVRLTGACIENWKRNNETKFTTISCDYIFRSYDAKNDTFLQRFPEDIQKTFLPHEFVNALQKVAHDVHLVFEHNVYWAAFAAMFERLCEKYYEISPYIESINSQNNGGCSIKISFIKPIVRAKVSEECLEIYEYFIKERAASDHEMLDMDRNSSLNNLFKSLLSFDKIVSAEGSSQVNVQYAQKPPSFKTRSESNQNRSDLQIYYDNLYNPETKEQGYGKSVYIQNGNGQHVNGSNFEKSLVRSNNEREFVNGHSTNTFPKRKQGIQFSRFYEFIGTQKELTIKKRKQVVPSFKEVGSRKEKNERESYLSNDKLVDTIFGFRNPYTIVFTHHKLCTSEYIYYMLSLTKALPSTIRVKVREYILQILGQSKLSLYGDRRKKSTTVHSTSDAISLLESDAPVFNIHSDSLFNVLPLKGDKAEGVPERDAQWMQIDQNKKINAIIRNLQILLERANKNNSLVFIVFEKLALTFHYQHILSLKILRQESSHLFFNSPVRDVKNVLPWVSENNRDDSQVNQVMFR
jgi:uncharacterized protein YjbI with pentapeptide repeats